MEKTKLQNIPSGHDGSGYVTLNGNVEAAFKITKVSAQLDITKETRRFLGERMAQSAIRGIAGTGSVSYAHTTSALIKAVKEYQRTGIAPAITLQYYAENGEVGRNEVVLRGVILDSVTFGALDDSSDNAIINDSAFSFNDFDIVEAFK